MTHRPSPALSRTLLFVGLLSVVAGTIDPMEGSIAILGGFALVALAAFLRDSPYRSRLYWSVFLVALGVASMFLFSALGGVGGTSGRSGWWALTMLPYPVGWVLGIIGSVRLIRDRSQPARRPV